MCGILDLELAEGWHLAPVDNGHQRRRRGAAPFAVAGHQRIEQRFHRPVESRVELVPEARHQRLFGKQLREPLAVAGACRRLSVVLRELQGVRQDERIRACGGAGRRITRVDMGQTDFRLAERQLSQQARRVDCHARHPLAQRPERLGHVLDPRFFSGVEKEGPEKRTQHAVAEPKAPDPLPLGEIAAQPGRVGVAEHSVPVHDRVKCREGCHG